FLSDYYVIYLIVPLSYLLFLMHPSLTAIYTLSLHDALPIFTDQGAAICEKTADLLDIDVGDEIIIEKDNKEYKVKVAVITENYIDRKSTRLNSSHVSNSYAVFCLKKKHEQMRAEFKKIHERL